ncbi:hypothetical protein NQ317_004833 [Molorchus minor]|uniref:Reverse transcriptase domain-containing protein n=1 Tax=Molorchus minor TaxID=1323400 RepID=A0ABQ9IT96_9CUCU|nr:hypothetical protein NQ317_004833 [Molorchus minor]
MYARPHHMLQTEEEVLDIVEDDPSTSTREIARQWSYTNVSIEGSLDIIRRKLEDDGLLTEKTNLPVDVAVKVIPEQYLFPRKGPILLTRRWTTYGLLYYLYPVMANIYMKWFETCAKETAKNKPKIWLRYVDDTFLIWDQEEIKLVKFLQHINNLRVSMFTMEKETNNELPFLEAKVERSDGQIKTSAYRKSTYTGQYLNHESNHPGCTKREVVRTLVDLL